MWRLQVATALFFLPSILADTASAPAGGSGSTVATTACGWDNLCAEKSPCCSEYGFCGSGQSCLSGCNPLGSLSTAYCAPVPVCHTANYTFADTSRIQTNYSAYNGDANDYDWTADHIDSSSTSLIENGALLLSLTEAGGGTRLSSTRSVLYADITASIKVTGKVGVVTAFITMSGVKDEIDWEWTTNDTDTGQTNYFWEGDVANFKHGEVVAAKDSSTEYLTYGILWGENELTWTVNGANVRTLKKSDTLDPNVPGLYHYPQTPSRIQLSVWPAGISSSSSGTIEWAGGLIDWNDPDYVAAGHFSATVQWLNVQCNDPPNLAFIAYNQSSTSSNSTSSRPRAARGLDHKAPLWTRQTNTVSSYLYGTNNSAGQIAVSGSDAQTVINSPYSTGLNMTIKGHSGNSTSDPNSTSAKVSNWWGKLPLVAHIGIIVGGIALFLVCLVSACTCYAKRGDKAKRYAALQTPGGSFTAASAKDNIALVEKASPRPRPQPQASYAEEPYTSSDYNGSTASFVPPYQQQTEYHSPPQAYQQQQYNQDTYQSPPQGYGQKYERPAYGQPAYGQPAYGQPAQDEGGYTQKYQPSWAGGR